SLRAAPHRIGHVLKLEHLAQDVETGTAVDRQRHLLAGQDVERVVRNFGVEIAERHPHFARQRVAFEGQRVAIIGPRELRANVRQRQFKILGLVKKHQVARYALAITNNSKTAKAVRGFAPCNNCASLNVPTRSANSGASVTSACFCTITFPEKSIARRRHCGATDVVRSETSDTLVTP